MKSLIEKITIKRLVIALFLIIGVVSIFLVINDNDKFKAKATTNNKQIEKLEKELKSISTEPTVKKETIRLNLNSASEVGVKVADLQNEYIKIRNNNADDIEGIKANGDKIRPYFKDVTDSHMQWYSATKPHTWVFATTYSVTEENIATIFLCYEKVEDKNTLLSYATAMYDAKEKKFTSLEVRNTTYGDTYKDAPATNNNEKVEEAPSN